MTLAMDASACARNTTWPVSATSAKRVGGTFLRVEIRQGAGSSAPADAVENRLIGGSCISAGPAAFAAARIVKQAAMQNASLQTPKPLFAKERLAGMAKKTPRLARGFDT
jgi:hypothetical protein